MMKKIINYVKLYTLDIILILRNVILSRVIIRPNYNVFKTLNIYMYVQTTNNIVAIAAKELFFFFFFLLVMQSCDPRSGIKAPRKTSRLPSID